MINKIKTEIEWVEAHLHENTPIIYEVVLYKEFYERVKEIILGVEQ